YGFGEVAGFLTTEYEENSFDWAITNPPYVLAEAFIQRALKVARRGVAMLTRTVFIESAGRYERLFKPNPPTVLAQFAERVPVRQEEINRNRIRLDCVAARSSRTPCRELLERDGDYDQRTGTRNSNRPVPSTLLQ